MNKVTSTKENTIVAHKTATKKIAATLADASSFHGSIVKAAPGGRKDSDYLDHRTYQCLATSCLNQGSVASGAFKRDTKFNGVTICVPCGGVDNRWIRDAAVAG